MKLKHLLKDIPVKAIRGSKEIEITGLTSNSKLVAPGHLFIAKKGITHNGARFIPDAVASGAVAILTDIYDPFFPQVTQIIHPDIPEIEAQLARHFYHFPDQQLFLVGITGTNGKTTTSYLIKHLLHSCGLIGTIEWIVGQHVFPSQFTTPDVITNYKLFHEMVTHGCESCVMEVSSHAIDQGRVRSIDFDVAVFTNLTQDHLDYHQTMEQYAAAKAKLFTTVKHRVINIDSPWHKQIAPHPTLTYGIDNPCDLRAENISLSSTGMDCLINYQGQTHPFHSSLIGRFNIYNCLAAIAVGIIKGYPIPKILDSLSQFPKVPGRLERVPNAKGLNIFVDYAHTDDALINVLQTLQEFKKGRLITVFGCGGNRDREKRPKMGAAAEAHSDLAIITTDNPRQEDPREIIQQILSGFKNPSQAIVTLDRAEAIQQAVNLTTPDDILLIAGKGHEAYQIFSHQTINFDDRLIAQKACQ